MRDVAERVAAVLEVERDAIADVRCPALQDGRQRAHGGEIYDSPTRPEECSWATE